MLEEQKAEAQQVLDELWNEHLIPFPLNVGRLITDAAEHTIYFHDSRLPTVQISLIGPPFIEAVRAAVLQRVAKMSGPLADWHPEKPSF